MVSVKRVLSLLLIASFISGCTSMQTGKTQGDESVSKNATMDNAEGVSMADGDSISADDSASALDSMSESQDDMPPRAALDAGAAKAETVTLSSIALSPSGNGVEGAVEVRLSAQAPYDLRRTAPSEYVLTVPGAIAAEAALAPLVAPAGGAGIRSARVREMGSVAQGDTLVEVRMFIDPELSLIAEPRGSMILVRALPPAVAAGGPVLSEARAQLASPDGAAVEGPLSGQSVLSSDGSKVYTGRLISLDLQDADIENALRIIAEVSNLNIITGDGVTGKVSLRLIDVPWDQALDVILKTNGLDQVREGTVIRIAPVDRLKSERQLLREAIVEAENLEQLRVKYYRVSYARATEIKDQVQSVLSERGTVAVDERTNQLIVRDIQKGLVAAEELVGKLDLRTPQVLLETQIVEANRSILRDLGFQWGFLYNRGPETGNAFGSVFPNTLGVSGGGNGIGSSGVPSMVSFPAAGVSSGVGSAITAVMDSADGSRTLAVALSAIEAEGRAHVVSRPQVATTNNKPATIKSVETVRVRTPDSGTTVGVGQGATAAGGGAQAFQEIEVGIELTVTPQASPDFYVLMDVYAKSSTFGSREATDGIPSTIDRDATSTVLVKSAQTFALGGVYRILDQDTVTGVPFLKDIPFLGTFFRSTSVDKADEELMFFITPHIVEGSFDESLVSRTGKADMIQPEERAAAGKKAS